MKRRRFEIIRRADMPPSFLHNNVRVQYVGTCPETKISFYSAVRCTYGVKVYPDGRKAVVNAFGVKRNKSYSHGKPQYLQYRHAFGHEQGILASHAVWMAAGGTIPKGMSIDHINGCTTDNRIENLRCISNAINNRDGGFLRKLRNKGINPASIERPYLLRYFARMARIKKEIKRSRYNHLTFDNLRSILYLPMQELTDYLQSLYNIKIEFIL